MVGEIVAAIWSIVKYLFTDINMFLKMMAVLASSLRLYQGFQFYHN